MRDAQWRFYILTTVIGVGGSLAILNYGLALQDPALLAPAAATTTSNASALILENLRGMMELIVLNIGYDLGILSPRIFAMMVVMAMVTTLMISPVLSLLARLEHHRAAVVGNA